jgi:hypothetical protein
MENKMDIKAKGRANGRRELIEGNVHLNCCWANQWKYI